LHFPREREGGKGGGKEGEGGEGVQECPNPELASLIRTSLFIIENIDLDVVCRRRLKASLPASKIQY